MEATRGRLNKIEAVFESTFNQRVWGIKLCEIKNVERLYHIIGRFDHLEVARGL